MPLDAIIKIVLMTNLGLCNLILLLKQKCKTKNENDYIYDYEYITNDNNNFEQHSARVLNQVSQRT